MKKALLTIALSVIAVGAMAQGKLTLSASTHLVKYTTAADGLKPGDSALAGQNVAASTFSVQLLVGSAGTPLGSLKPFFTTPPVIGGTAGLLPGTAMTLNGANGTDSVAGNVFAAFSVLVYETTAGSYAQAVATGKYAGTSGLQQVKTGVTLGSALDSTVASTSWTGGAPLYVVAPEPGTAAIVGMGLASLLIFRRRK